MSGNNLSGTHIHTHLCTHTYTHSNAQSFTVMECAWFSAFMEHKIQFTNFSLVGVL